MKGYLLALKVLLYGTLVTIFTGCSDVECRRFDSYEELVGSAYYGKDWIPWDYPESTFDIVEKHDLDTNEVWIKCSYSNSFEFGKRDMKQSLNKADRLKIDGIFGLKYSDVEYFSIGKGEVIAVDKSKKKLYYYRRR